MRGKQPANSGQRSRDERGSALLMAVFVLAIVGAMGIALLFQTSIEVKTSRTSLDVKKAFYLAEAGLEDARATLWNNNDKGQGRFRQRARGTPPATTGSSTSMPTSWSRPGTPAAT